ncbi:MAG: alpha/beta hydrolase [Candidatus Eisenbacteria bacterium]|nr:alpha/beta hydrolase [Candidatus Eisenbacteria bacterium]
MPSPAPATPSLEQTSSAARETPMFFESGERPLYAVFHAARIARAGAPVVVYCHSLGVEQLTNYRNQVNLARAAAARGLPAFRYHARGHGDSGGDYADVTLATLVADARAAAARARALAGAARVVWVGERVGALVAAAALADDAQVAGLAMWEPVHRPAEYFRAMLRGMLFSQVAHGARPNETVDQLLERLAREGKVDVHGYYLHRELVESLEPIALEQSLARWSGPTLVAQVQARPRLAPANAQLAATLEARGARVVTLAVAEEPGWHFISNPAWESETLVRGTAEWLDGLA